MRLTCCLNNGKEASATNHLHVMVIDLQTELMFLFMNSRRIMQILVSHKSSPIPWLHFMFSFFGDISSSGIASCGKMLPYMKDS